MSHLPGSPSPEARAALAAYEDAAHDLASKLRECTSGKQLAAKGFEHDVSLSAELDVLGLRTHPAGQCLCHVEEDMSARDAAPACLTFAD